MPWLSSSKTKPPDVPAAVPDTSVLRSTALQASWRRDRWVGRRRVALRWSLFYLRNYGLQGMLLMGMGLFVWLRIVPWLVPPLQQPAAGVAIALPPLSVVRPEQPAHSSAPEALMPISPETNPPLRLERQSAAVSARPISVHEDDSPAPRLKPDQWLHSQEP